MVNSPDIQQILKRYLPSYCKAHPLDARSREVCRHIVQCHTEAMGGLQMQCERCAHEQTVYFSCRDRHCPQCGYRASQQWAQKQQQNRLPVDYHHLVFTVPHDLNPWIQLHPEIIYRLLFQSAWHTLNTFGHDAKRLGGQLGATIMLHTWGQTLCQHVHLHCLIPGGVLTSEGQWNPAKSTYLFPVRALSRHFRGTVASKLREAYEAGELTRVTDPAEPRRTLDPLMSKEWNVFNHPCINHTQDVVAYLARYSHRTAISNNRILDMEDNQIRFSYKDYKDNKRKVMELESEEFIRRFVFHILPKGLQRMRYYGFLANSCRAKRLKEIREAVGKQQAEEAQPDGGEGSGEQEVRYNCEKCKVGRLRCIAELPKSRFDGG